MSGIATLFDGHLQMLHPDRVVDADGFAKLPLIDPVYPLTEGLHPNQVRKAVDAALERIPKLPEWQDAAWLARNRLSRILPARCAQSIVPKTPTRSIRQVRHGRG